ncbi:MAG TPA: class I SAM-dependent methyltransferase [Candidatus Acidoferrales bacterium]|nr:class I SAM-dependent methyltransferase [Candidatus Acidoferrales bacterium]
MIASTEIRAGSGVSVDSLELTRQKVFARLACPECASPQLTFCDGAIRCQPCGASFPLRQGVAVMLAGTAQMDQKELQYPPPPPSRLKQGLANLGLLPVARSLWRAWLRVDAALTPATEASVETHVRRLADSLHRAYPQPIDVLDLGGGSGPYKSWLIRPGETYAIVEIDPDSASVVKNRDRNVYVIGNAHRLPFQPASFDVVCLFEVLEHLYDPREAMRNCSRVLRPGGCLLLTVPQYWHVHGWPSDYYRYTIHGLRHLCREAGLEIEQHWAMGGPFLLLASVAELNFSPVLRLPLVRHLFTRPVTKLCDWADKIFFRHNLRRAYPDTRGWSLIARKPGHE